VYILVEHIMKKPSHYLSFIAIMLFTAGCVHDYEINVDKELRQAVAAHSTSGSSTEYILPESDDYASLPNQDPKNPITESKVRLGKMLFFETGLGVEAEHPLSRATYSCATCHMPERGYSAGRFQGIADGAIGFGQAGEGRHKSPLYGDDLVDAQGVRPLPIINTAYVTNALWSGAFGSFDANAGTESVWDQDTLVAINNKYLMGLEANNARAMIVHRQLMNKEIADFLGYTSMFDEAFPEIPEEERYTRLTSSFALAAYFRTILTNEAPFQKWLKGDVSAMTEAQKRGGMLFFGKAGCVSCHNSPSLNTLPHKFFSVGVKNLHQSGYEVYRTDDTDKRTLGRGGFTGLQEDMYRFKVPQLYNLKDVSFYFHGASKSTLREVVEYFNVGIPENKEIPASQITSLLRPLNLTPDEVDDLVEFLENGLYDPNLQRYAPQWTMSGNCFPNNDPESRIDLGCN